MTKNNNSPMAEQLEAIIAKAEELAQSRNYEGSIELYEQVIEILKEVEIDRDYLANLMTQKIDRSIHYFHGKEFGKAIQELNQILKMPLPQSLVSKIKINRSLCYLQSGQWEKAIDDCQSIIEIDPHYSHAYYSLGVIYKAQERYENAVASFTTAVEMPFKTGRSMPKNLAIECWIEKAVCQGKLGFLQDAMESLSLGQVLSPENPEIFCYARGLILEEFIESEEDIKTVLNQYIDALKIDPTYISPHLRLGNLFSKLEDYQTAISAYESVIEIDHNNEEAYKNRGLLYQKLGQYPEALADYNQVLRINDNNPEIYYQRGIVYELFGEQELAILDFEKVSELEEYSDFNNQDENYELFSYFFPENINPIQATNLIKKFTVFCEQKQVIPYFSKFYAGDTAIMDACVFDKYENEEILIFDAMQECYQKYKGPFYFGSDFEIFIKNPDSCSYSSFVIFNEFGLIIKNPLTLPGFFAPVSSPTTPFEKLFWNNCNYDLLGIAEKDNKLVIVIQPHENLYMGITNMKDDDSFQVREQKKSNINVYLFPSQKIFTNLPRI
ncbi:tetratricopeptide repeat protein [Geminocystis sp. CENA526]|uniref:tetratricopeptide repeat protein n=1 Tax=Geminocystis sp. CENA526 TaxID=1355871 RepID=UPI003D6F4FDF